MSNTAISSLVSNHSIQSANLQTTPALDSDISDIGNLALSVFDPPSNNIPLLDQPNQDGGIMGNIANIATEQARNALITPLLAENNREHLAIILANSSKTKPFQAAFGLIAIGSCLSYAALWFGILPLANSATGSILNIVAIGLGALMLAHSLMDQGILWYLDVDFKKQAKEVLMAFNQNISLLQQANREFYKNILSLQKANNELHSENKKYQSNNLKLQTSIRSLDSLIQNTTGQVSYWMDVAMKEDEDSKKTLRKLKTQLTKASQQAVDGYQMFLGIANNLGGIKDELKILTKENEDITKEYKAVLGEIITVQKQLNEQKFIENLRGLARKVDHFADQGAKQRIDEAIAKAQSEKSDKVILSLDGCLKIQSFLGQLDQILSEKDALNQCEQSSASNQKLWSIAEERLCKINAPGVNS